ncbi:TPA: dUTP diphosphatase [Candidatus Woesearchaeota archaeon]|nr:dUTP diphosphatase [Candidatus Woesearchaeota archaeon]
MKIHNMDPEVDAPSYTRDNDAAFDLRSREELVLKAGERRTVKTGLKMAIPDGHVGLIWDRSGHAHKHGIHCLAGVIDSEYRGEVGVVMKNLGENDFTIEKNMRIAQMLIQPVVTAKLVAVESEEDLGDTNRGAGSFGSSGNR